MITLTKLKEYLDHIMIYDSSLNTLQIDPFMANGLQIRGSAEISKIAFGVSASIRLFDASIASKCQALIVHHALNPLTTPNFDEIYQNRISKLLSSNISLFGYHFLLDSHPTIGNNAGLIKILGGEIIKPYIFSGAPWGFYAKIPSISLEKLLEKLKPYLSPTTRMYPYGPKEIKTMVVLSGKGIPYPSNIQELKNNNVDLYITGEVAEWVRELFLEAGITYIAGGHYHTERIGLKMLEKMIQKDLAIPTEFIEIENEV